MIQDQDIVERLRLRSGTRNFLVTEATALDAAEAIERLTQELAGMVESANSYANQAARMAISLSAAERQLATAREVVRETNCPRPANHRPDEFTAGQCFDAGECGCHVATALTPGETQ